VSKQQNYTAYCELRAGRTKTRYGPQVESVLVRLNPEAFKRYRRFWKMMMCCCGRLVMVSIQING